MFLFFTGEHPFLYIGYNLTTTNIKSHICSLFVVYCVSIRTEKYTYILLRTSRTDTAWDRSIIIDNLEYLFLYFFKLPPLYVSSPFPSHSFGWKLSHSPICSSENNKNNAEINHSSLLHRNHPTKKQEGENFSERDKKSIVK